MGYHHKETSLHCKHCGNALIEISVKDMTRDDYWYECRAAFCESGGNKQYHTKEDVIKQVNEALNENNG